MSETKKHTTTECLEFALEEVRANPNLIKMHVSLLTNYDIDQFNDTLWPGVFDANNWSRLATRRPSKSDEDDAAASASASGMSLGFMGGYGGGTDKVIRTYENDLWYDHSRKLIITVTELYGNLEASFDIGW